MILLCVLAYCLVVGCGAGAALANGVNYSGNTTMHNNNSTCANMMLSDEWDKGYVIALAKECLTK